MATNTGTAVETDTAAESNAITDTDSVARTGAATTATSDFATRHSTTSGDEQGAGEGAGAADESPAGPASDQAGVGRTLSVANTPRRVTPVRRLRGAWRPTVGALIIAALVGAAGFFGYHYLASDARGTSTSDSEQVLALANDYAVKLSSFDYRDLDKNRSEISGKSTEEFGKKYGEMVGALTEIVSNGKGEATAEVTHSAIADISDHEATVILFVDQSAKNVVAPEGRSQPYRMVIKLKNVAGNWLVDDVETV